MTFIFREPTLIEILSDPITKAVMNADAVDPAQLAVMLCEVQVLRRGGNDGNGEVAGSPERKGAVIVASASMVRCNSIC